MLVEGWGRQDTEGDSSSSKDTGKNPSFCGQQLLPADQTCTRRAGGVGEPCLGRGSGDWRRVTPAAASVWGLRGVAEPLREHRQEPGTNHCFSLEFQLQFSLQILAIKGGASTCGGTY